METPAVEELSEPAMFFVLALSGFLPFTFLISLFEFLQVFVIVCHSIRKSLW